MDHLSGVARQELEQRRAEQADVFACFCLESWPQWIVQRCAGRFDTPWERRHRLLAAGLEAIR